MALVPTRLSEIFQRITPRRQDIPLYVHPEGKDEVDNEGRAHGEEGDVDEPGPDTRSGDTHSFTNCCAHPEHLPLDEVFQSVHRANL